MKNTEVNKTDVNSTEVNTGDNINTGDTEPKVDNTEKPVEEKQDAKTEKEEQIEWDMDMFKKLIQTEQGKKEIQRAMDRATTKGLETWKTNNLDKIVNEEIEKRNPTDPDKMLIKKLNEEIQQREIREVAIKTLAQKNLPVELAEFFTQVQDIQVVTEGLDKFIQAWDSKMKIAITERLKQIGGTPTNEGTMKSTRMTKAELLRMDYAERSSFYTNSPDEFNRIMRLG